MKYLIYTDVHWCTYSSILRSRGKNYSKRLENLITSVNWAEHLAVDLNCNEIICLGDFFNKPDLTSEELTSLIELCWNSLPHNFIVGNHDASTKNLTFNSVNVLAKLSNFNIIDKVQYVPLSGGKVGLLYLPYFQDDIRSSIAEYREELKIPKEIKLIVLSHNDVKGIQYGPILSQSGIELEDIENNCALFLNGHIHNGSQFCKNGFNLGNLTGKVFEEDAFIYNHSVLILNVNETTGEIDFEYVENPFAYNFYKINVNSLEALKAAFSKIKNNAVLSIKCPVELVSKVKEEISNTEKIAESKITQVMQTAETEVEVTLESFNDVNYLLQFKDFTLNQLGYSEALKEELDRIIANL